jgi:hypothetical protein
MYWYFNLMCFFVILLTGFDANQVFYSDNFGGDAGGPGDAQNLTNLAAKKRLKEFLRQFHEEGNNLSFKYRDGLRRNYALREYWIRVNIIQDFLCKLGIKPHMHLVKISTFSQK